jgi:hypothetical protein
MAVFPAWRMPVLVGATPSHADATYACTCAIPCTWHIFQSIDSLLLNAEQEQGLPGTPASTCLFTTAECCTPLTFTCVPLFSLPSTLNTRAPSAVRLASSEWLLPCLVPCASSSFTSGNCSNRHVHTQGSLQDMQLACVSDSSICSCISLGVNIQAAACAEACASLPERNLSC